MSSSSPKGQRVDLDRERLLRERVRVAVWMLEMRDVGRESERRSAISVLWMLRREVWSAVWGELEDGARVEK